MAEKFEFCKKCHQSTNELADSRSTVAPFGFNTVQHFALYFIASYCAVILCPSDDTAVGWITNCRQGNQPFWVLGSTTDLTPDVTLDTPTPPHDDGQWSWWWCWLWWWCWWGFIQEGEDQTARSSDGPSDVPVSVSHHHHSHCHRHWFFQLPSSFVSLFLAPQSGALRISAYRDFQSHTHTQSTYSFRAFKPFYCDQKQCM